MNTNFYAKYKDQNQHGAVLILVAVAMVAFLGIAALAIDVGFLMAGKNELQNAADAAALAGASVLAREDPDNFNVNEDKIRQAAIEVAGLNSASNNKVQLSNENVKIGIWDWDGDPGEYEDRFVNGSQPYNAVKVDIGGHNIKTFFTPDFGLGATAVAIVAPIVSMKGLVPLGVTDDEASLLKESGPNAIYYFDKNSGNWGTLNLDKDETGAAGANDIHDWMLNGYDGYVSVGDLLTPQPGVGSINSIRDECQQLEGEILYVPVIDSFDTGASEFSTVMGFIAIKIKEVSGQGSNTKIYVEYIEDAVASGSVDFGMQNFGIVGVKLVM